MEAERKEPTPWLLRGLLLLFISVLVLLVVRAAPVTFADGWIPTAALLSALGLLVAALIEVYRAR